MYALDDDDDDIDVLKTIKLFSTNTCNNNNRFDSPRFGSRFALVISLKKLLLIRYLVNRLVNGKHVLKCSKLLLFV